MVIVHILGYCIVAGFLVGAVVGIVAIISIERDIRRKESNGQRDGG